MSAQLSPSEQLTYSTVRIEADLPGGRVGTGTAFCFAFLRDGDQHVPALVTNKHVVKGARSGRFLLHVRNQSGQLVRGDTLAVQLEQFEARWLPHPDPAIDLCILPTAPLIAEAEAKGKPAFFVQLDDSLVPSDSELADLTALEDIIMIGYPSGIWDSVNNAPIIRRGITATHPAVNYEGRPEFMIDAACFPGSSGSPVLLFNVGSYATKDGGTVIGSRIKLLGILYAGPQFTAEGEVKVVAVPTQQQVVASSRIPMNLGLAIRSKLLLGFNDALRAVIASAGA